MRFWASVLNNRLFLQRQDKRKHSLDSLYATPCTMPLAPFFLLPVFLSIQPHLTQASRRHAGDSFLFQFQGWCKIPLKIRLGPELLVALSSLVVCLLFVVESPSQANPLANFLLAEAYTQCYFREAVHTDQ